MFRKIITTVLVVMVFLLIACSESQEEVTSPAFIDVGEYGCITDDGVVHVDTGKADREYIQQQCGTAPNVEYAGNSCTQEAPGAAFYVAEGVPIEHARTLACTDPPRDEWEHLIVEQSLGNWNDSISHEDIRAGLPSTTRADEPLTPVDLLEMAEEANVHSTRGQSGLPRGHCTHWHDDHPKHTHPNTSHGPHSSGKCVGV